MRRAVEHKEGKADLCDYVRAIRQTAAAFGLPVLDLYEREDLSVYTPDGLHPNDEGHALLARLFQNFLQTL